MGLSEQYQNNEITTYFFTWQFSFIVNLNVIKTMPPLFIIQNCGAALLHKINEG
jgi:hypothetical protein